MLDCSNSWCHEPTLSHPVQYLCHLDPPYHTGTTNFSYLPCASVNLINAKPTLIKQVKDYGFLRIK